MHPTKFYPAARRLIDQPWTLLAASPRSLSNTSQTSGNVQISTVFGPLRANGFGTVLFCAKKWRSQKKLLLASPADQMPTSVGFGGDRCRCQPHAGLSHGDAHTCVVLPVFAAYPCLRGLWLRQRCVSANAILLCAQPGHSRLEPGIEASRTQTRIHGEIHHPTCDTSQRVIDLDNLRQC